MDAHESVLKFQKISFFPIAIENFIYSCSETSRAWVTHQSHSTGCKIEHERER